MGVAIGLPAPSRTVSRLFFQHRDGISTVPIEPSRREISGIADN